MQHHFSQILNILQVQVCWDPSWIFNGCAKQFIALLTTDCPSGITPALFARRARASQAHLSIFDCSLTLRTAFTPHFHVVYFTR
jgi:hypothetical protein